MTDYVVIDHEGYTSGDPKDGDPQTFKTLAAARKRAGQIARNEPGQTIRIYGVIEEHAASVSPVMIKPVRRSCRRQPE